MFWRSLRRKGLSGPAASSETFGKQERSLPRADVCHVSRLLKMLPELPAAVVGPCSGAWRGRGVLVSSEAYGLCFDRNSTCWTGGQSRRSIEPVRESVIFRCGYKGEDEFMIRTGLVIDISTEGAVPCLATAGSF